MLVTDGDLRPIGITSHLSRQGLEGVIDEGAVDHLDNTADSQLAVGIATPGPEGSIGSNGGGTVLAGRNGHPDLPGLTDLHRQKNVGGNGSDPCLSQCVTSPGPKAPVGFQRQSVALSRRYGIPIGIAADLQRGGLIA